MDKEVLRHEAAHYRHLADQLRDGYADLDDETLTDTLEGLSDLPQIIEEIVRSSLEDEALMVGLKSRMEAMSARLNRFKARHEKKRTLTVWAMGSAGLGKLAAADFSVSLSAGALRLVVAEDAKLPEAYLIPQPAKPDRAGLTAALKRGEAIVGASLIPGDPYITVRTR